MEITTPGKVDSDRVDLISLKAKALMEIIAGSEIPQIPSTRLDKTVFLALKFSLDFVPATSIPLDQ